LFTPSPNAFPISAEYQWWMVTTNYVKKLFFVLNMFLLKCFKLFSIMQQWYLTPRPSKLPNRIGGVMVSMLASSVVDCRFEPRSGKTKDYTIGICCFSAKHAAFRRKSKDWFARNQDNVSEWRDMSTRGLLFQWASTINIQLYDLM
jgi:hypothetical protein